MKRTVIIVASVIAAVLLNVFGIYFFKCRELIDFTEELITASYTTYGELPMKYKGVIGEEIFAEFCHRSKPRQKEITETLKVEDYRVRFEDNTAIVKYVYTYSQRDRESGEALTGSLCIPCEVVFEKQGDMWIPVSHYESL